MQRSLLAVKLSIALLLVTAGPTLAAKPAFGQLYYEDQVVRTIVPPAASPKEGRDNLYKVDNGVAGQLAIAAVAPGDRDYHGGHWKVFHVTFTGAPYLLTSEDAVLAAEQAGDVTITRTRAEDFRCPILP